MLAIKQDVAADDSSATVPLVGVLDRNLVCQIIDHCNAVIVSPQKYLSVRWCQPVAPESLVGMTEDSRVPNLTVQHPQ